MAAPDRDPALEAALRTVEAQRLMHPLDGSIKQPASYLARCHIEYGWDAAFRSLGAGTPEAVAALRALVRALMEQRRTLNDYACTAAQWVAATDVAYSAGKSFAALATPTEVGR